MALTAMDRVEIEDLIARYNKAIDSGDAEAWADTFTPDGEFHGVVGDFFGRDELVAFLKAYATEEQFRDFATARHWATNIVVEGDGDDATLFCHLMMVAPTDDGGGRISFIGHYEDELRRINGRWLFTKRFVKVP
jgi:uncharacterized protein (TIGR02246 family)